MKVLFTFGGLPHYYNYVLNQLNRFPDTQIHVVVPKASNKAVGKGVHQSEEDIEFTKHPLIEKNGWYGKPIFIGLDQLIKKEKPAILVTIWPYILGFLFIPSWKKALRESGTKLIFKDIPFNIPRYEDAIRFFTKEIRNEDLRPPKSGFFRQLYYLLVRNTYKRMLKLADAHVYYAETAYDIIPSYGVDRSKIFMIYNSPDTDRLFKIKEELCGKMTKTVLAEKRLLHVGRLVKWKKVDQLIEAFEQVLADQPDCKLRIIGKGPEEEHLLDQVRQKGIENQVEFIGAVYDAHELGQHILESSIYVLAGMGGLSINEAMVYGKPVICSVADGTEVKLVRDGFNGYLFEEDNITDLANSIRRLLTDEQKLIEFGANSEKIIREEINIHTVVDGYKKAFEFCRTKRMNSE